MTAHGLPPILREAIARMVRDIQPAELAARAAKLSDNYRARGGSETIKSFEDVAAYLATRMPATFAAMIASLDWTKVRLVDFAPLSVLDIGAGAGAASWAAAEIFPSLQSFTMLDRNRQFLGAARTLADAHALMRDAAILESDIAILPNGTQADLVLANYALTELSDDVLTRAVPHLWTATKGVLVIVEPGTPDGFARILKCRASLLKDGARIVAPCPGDYPCPIAKPGWCHFAARLPRSRAHIRAKGGAVPFEDEKFSYLAVAHENVGLRPSSPRILSRPHALKHALRVRICADGGIAEHEASKRDKESYRAFARKDWGDAV